MSYCGWNVGRKPPPLRIELLGQKKRKEKGCLTSHEISAANTSSQLKSLIKGVRAEEMHFPN